MPNDSERLDHTSRTGAADPYTAHLGEGARRQPAQAAGWLCIGRQVVLEDEVDDRQPSARPKDAEGLGKNPHLARRD